MCFFILVYSDRIKMPWLMLFFFLVSCESDYKAHSHQSLGQTLFNCSTIISATVEIKKMLPMGEKKLIKKVFKSDELTNANSVFKTMCVAKAERNFKVDASRLGKYGLGEFYFAKIKLDFSNSQSIKLYFGRTTPDTFGQYVKIEKTPNFMNLFHPTTNVLVVPAYHLNSVAAVIE